MSDGESQPIVVDLGSGFIKAGFAGDVDPTVVFPSILGRPSDDAIQAGKGQKNCYVGYEAQDHRDNLTRNNPIKRGIVTDPDDVEEIFKFIFRKEFSIIPKEHSVLITEKLNNPKAIREKLTEMMFEHFESPSLFIGTQAALSLYASSRTSGVILDCGDGITNAVSIYEGIALTNSIKSLDFAGSDLTKILKDRFPSLNMKTLQEVKEKLCYVAFDIDHEKKNTKPLDKSFVLPDGQTVDIGSESFLCPEALFEVGVQKITYQSIQNVDQIIRDSFFKNIVIAGGTTMLPGFVRRLQKEVQNLVPAATTIKIISPSERKTSAWIGGSILASLSTFPQMAISKKEYEEFGSGIVNLKCF